MPDVPPRAPSPPRHSIWAFPLFTWFSPGFYADIGLRGRGVGVVPLLGIAVFAGLIAAAGLVIGVSMELNDPDTLAFIEELPPFRIDDGVVSSPVAQPWLLDVEDPDGDRVFLGLDTTGTVVDIPGDVVNGVLLTRDEVIMVRPGRGTQITPLADVDEFVFEGSETVWSWATWFVVLGAPLWGILAGLWTFVVRLLLTLATGAVLQQLGKAHGLDFAGGMRIAALGMFPPVVLFGLLDLTGLIDGFWLLTWFVFLLLAAPFWALAVWSLGQDEGGVSGPSGGGSDGREDPWAAPADGSA